MSLFFLLRQTATQRSKTIRPRSVLGYQFCSQNSVLRTLGANSVLSQQELCKLTILQTLGLTPSKAESKWNIGLTTMLALTGFCSLEAVTPMSYETLHISPFLYISHQHQQDGNKNTCVLTGAVKREMEELQNQRNSGMGTKYWRRHIGRNNCISTKKGGKKTLCHSPQDGHTVDILISLAEHNRYNTSHWIVSSMLEVNMGLLGAAPY